MVMYSFCTEMELVHPRRLHQQHPTLTVSERHLEMMIQAPLTPLHRSGLQDRPAWNFLMLSPGMTEGSIWLLVSMGWEGIQLFFMHTLKCFMFFHSVGFRGDGGNENDLDVVSDGTIYYYCSLWGWFCWQWMKLYFTQFLTYSFLFFSSPDSDVLQADLLRGDGDADLWFYQPVCGGNEGAAPKVVHVLAGLDPRWILQVHGLTFIHGHCSSSKCWSLLVY